jgi:hypothetical protein
MLCSQIARLRKEKSKLQAGICKKPRGGDMLCGLMQDRPVQGKVSHRNADGSSEQNIIEFAVASHEEKT